MFTSFTRSIHIVSLNFPSYIRQCTIAGMSLRTNTAPKRKRTTHACDSCRQRKSRCNGARPMCDVCLGMGFECHYRDPVHPQARAPDTPSASPLEGRLEAMEAVIQHLLSRSNEPQLPDTPWTDSASAAATAEVHPFTSDSVDGMCAITFAGEYVPGYFGLLPLLCWLGIRYAECSPSGPTSSSSFFKNIIDATREIHSGADARARRPPISKPPSPPPEASPDGQSTRSLAAGVVNPFYLPQHQEVVTLLEVFFTNTGRLFPYLYSSAIFDLNAVSRPIDPAKANRAYLCILNMVMAFASIHTPSRSTSIVNKLSQGNAYFRRALYMLGGMRPTDATLESGMDLRSH